MRVGFNGNQRRNTKRYKTKAFSFLYELSWMQIACITHQPEPICCSDLIQYLPFQFINNLNENQNRLQRQQQQQQQQQQYCRAKPISN